MNKLIDAITSHARTVISLLVFVILAGSSAYIAIPKEKEPDVQIPIIYVSMHHEGIAPKDAERLLIKPMEKSLRAIEGIKEITAVGSEGHASVVLEFHAGFNSEKALADVREKVDEAKVELPEDTDEPTVNEINLSQFPVLNIILTGPIAEHQLITIARKLRDEIEATPNVLNVDIAGDREDIIEMIVPPKVIETYKLSITEIFSIFQRNNLLIAAGALNTLHGSFNVKVPGLIEKPNDINSIPIKANGDRILTIPTIATAYKTYRDRDGFARANGQNAIVLEVSKRTGSNIIETIEAVKNKIEIASSFFPPNLHIIYAQDQSSSIRGILTDLQNNIILAILLVIIVMIAVIGIQSATFAAIAIPGAFLIGILILSSLQLSLNIVVLFSLILSIGMLVDSAIVICEYADRKMVDGASHKDAYRDSAKRMAWPLISSTLTTLVVFMPLLFWPGIVGQFMQYMPITLIATLTGSLIMALIFIPTLGTVFGRTRHTSEAERELIHASEAGEINALKGLTKSYAHTLKKVMKKPARFVRTIVAGFILIIMCYSILGKGVEFFPDIEPENIKVLVHARGNLSTKEKDTILHEVENAINDLDQDIKVFYARSGTLPSNGNNYAEDVIGIIQIEFQPWKYRRSALEIQEDILQRTQSIPGVIVEVSKEKSGPGKNKPIQIEISSYDPDLIETPTSEIRNYINKLAGLRNIEDNKPIPAIEWNMHINKNKALKFQADTLTIGNYIRLATNGLKLSTYRPNYTDEEVDIIARFPEHKRNLTELDHIKVITSDGPVPISYFVDRIAKQNVSTIHRTNARRAYTIKADIEYGILADDKISKIQQWINAQAYSPLINITFKGEKEDQDETKSFLSTAFLTSLFFMALILVTQFNSFYQMFTIMSAVILSIAGVLIGLLITQQPFGIVMCGVGIISLAGIVVNNNIIFIDTYNILRKQGLPAEDAILRTGITRLRPILLTALTTILGLLPMVLGLNIDFTAFEISIGAPSSQWWKQLSTAIAGGLTFTTILTLFFTPALLILKEKRTTLNES